MSEKTESPSATVIFEFVCEFFATDVDNFADCSRTLSEDKLERKLEGTHDKLRITLWVLSSDSLGTISMVRAVPFGIIGILYE